MKHAIPLSLKAHLSSLFAYHDMVFGWLTTWSCETRMHKQGAKADKKTVGALGIIKAIPSTHVIVMLYYH